MSDPENGVSITRYNYVPSWFFDNDVVDCSEIEFKKAFEDALKSFEI